MLGNMGMPSVTCHVSDMYMRGIGQHFRRGHQRQHVCALGKRNTAHRRPKRCFRWATTPASPPSGPRLCDVETRWSAVQDVPSVRWATTPADLPGTDPASEVERQLGPLDAVLSIAAAPHTTAAPMPPQGAHPSACTECHLRHPSGRCLPTSKLQSTTSKLEHSSR